MTEDEMAGWHHSLDGCESGRSEEHTSELQSPSAVILEPPEIKSATVSTSDGTRCHDLSFLNVEF